jgi:hypothetical protein
MAKHYTAELSSEKGNKIMKIELHQIKIRDVYEGYVNNDEEGVIGYGGRLNIRPKYQREFIYGDKNKVEVIKTVKKGFPLNVMYWCRNADGSFELLDGQQRTIILCEYVDGNFSVDGRFFYTLQPDEQDKILDYELMIYVCEGTDSEKLDWFKIINIAGLELTDQELRNAIFTGEWLSDCKKYFSKSNCIAYKIGEKYMSGTPIRQDYLETVLDWIRQRDGVKSIDDYMGLHQLEHTATEVKSYYQAIINWIETIFIKYRKEMKGQKWGLLYNRFRHIDFDPQKLEEQISRLMKDEYDEITSKKGIYEYVLSGDEKCLSIRTFKDNEKRTVYERQGGKCRQCGKACDIGEMEADHITPYSKGGHTTIDNCQMLCRDCNRRKSAV